MILELLVIGNEVLIGKTQDTNSSWMAKRITKYGHKIRRITTIGDDLNEIASAIQEILNRNPDMIISTGGLGPTFDDMTNEGIAQGLDRELVLDEHAYNSIKKAYKNAYEQGILKLEGMTPERKKMAYMPKGSTPLPNTKGTAPGVKLEENNIDIYILPGVPAEMKKMFRTVIKPILKEKKGKFYEDGFIFSGIGESQIAKYTSKLEDKHPDLWIKTHPRVGLSVEVEISITCFDKPTCEKQIEEVLTKLKEIVKELGGTIKEKSIVK
ncbi:MAG: competence damage-inducible protein A [Promethearchaeota archaeon]|nr:MAG: competence damage-inducible protein A [Candidatus Lokiarchaeota archaeon]